MKIYGTSVLNGLLYTLKNFVSSYVEDFRRMNGKNNTPVHGLRSASEGVVTVQYPEEPMPIGATYERFRVLPMLVYDELETKDEQGNPEKDVRCTSCGICSKVCPPQCIWIFQDTNELGKPVPHPKEFYIDASVCMNCGLCAEFCPFDAIKMDHKFELNTTTDRQESYLYDLDKLLVSSDYYGALHPKANAAEIETRRLEAEAKAAKEVAKKEAAAKKASAAKAKKEAEAKAAEENPEAAKSAEATPEPKAVDPERAAKIAAAKAKREAAKATTTVDESAKTPKASDDA